MSKAFVYSFFPGLMGLTHWMAGIDVDQIDMERMMQSTNTNSDFSSSDANLSSSQYTILWLVRVYVKRSFTGILWCLEHWLLPSDVAQKCPEVVLVVPVASVLSSTEQDLNYYLHIRNPILCMWAFFGIIIGLAGVLQQVRLARQQSEQHERTLRRHSYSHRDSGDQYIWFAMAFGWFSVMNMSALPLHGFLPSPFPPSTNSTNANTNSTMLLGAGPILPASYPFLWMMDCLSTGLSSICLFLGWWSRVRYGQELLCSIQQQKTATTTTGGGHSSLDDKNIPQKTKDPATIKNQFRMKSQQYEQNRIIHSGGTSATNTPRTTQKRFIPSWISALAPLRIGRASPTLITSTVLVPIAVSLTTSFWWCSLDDATIHDLSGSSSSSHLDHDILPAASVLKKRVAWTLPLELWYLTPTALAGIMTCGVMLWETVMFQLPLSIGAKAKNNINDDTDDADLVDGKDNDQHDQDPSTAEATLERSATATIPTMLDNEKSLSPFFFAATDLRKAFLWMIRSSPAVWCMTISALLIVGGLTLDATFCRCSSTMFTASTAIFSMYDTFMVGTMIFGACNMAFISLYLWLGVRLVLPPPPHARA